jgi:hypothetical protein
MSVKTGSEKKENNTKKPVRTGTLSWLRNPCGLATEGGPKLPRDGRVMDHIVHQC